MENNSNNFIQKNSPDGALKNMLQGKDFLQSSEWRNFQESVRRKTYDISSEGFWASIIEHTLLLVGKYFYVPRGPVIGEIANNKFQISNKDSISNDQIQNGMQRLINLAKKNGIGWIRIEPNDENVLEIIKNSVGVRFIEPGKEGFNKLNPYGRGKYKITKAPHDMQPRELFIIDITKPEEELLADMKSKTRYNIKLAQKRSVKIHLIYNSSNSPNLPAGEAGKIPNHNDQVSKYINEFLRLVNVTAERDGITPHPESYYRKMIEAIPGDILKLYVAEYGGKVIAANLVIFYGDTCTYLHGGSDNENRNVMAPYLLQWRQIQDAKNTGCKKYDFGGIHTKTGEGITRFKLGFSPNAKPTKFPGCFDVIINPRKYWLYRAIQKAKSLIR